MLFRHRFPTRAALAMLATLLLSACASARKPDQIDELLGQALRAAEAHHEFELHPEAAVLVDAIAAVDPSYPGVRELDDDLDADARLGVVRNRIGMSLAIRPQLKRSTRARVMLWLPDRILDLLDVASFGVHFGIGAFADGHVTRALQIGGGVRTTGGVGLYGQRSLGLKSQSEAGLTLIAAGTHTYAGSLVGTGGTRSATDSWTGAHRPMSPLYQELRDYWALGASGTAGIVGFDVELHPLQLADFLAGFVGVDFLNDDFARTRRLRLDPVESKLVSELRRVAASEQTLAAYHEAKRMAAPASFERPHREPTPAVQPSAGDPSRR